MKNNPLISVILPVYNSENYILECLESLKIQTLQNFEVILIDDKSTDKSLKIIKYYLKNHLYGKFKIIKNKSNIGITRSLNKAFKISNSKYIARIDADDINKPDRFEIQFKYLEKNDDISLVGSNVEYISKDGKFIQYSDLPLNHIDIKSSLFLYNPIVHSTIFFRKKIFNNSPYNEKFYTSQDYDMYCRIINSHKFANIKKSLVKYRFHNQSISSHKEMLQKKNSLIIQEQYYKQNFGKLFPVKKFKLFNNYFMSDLNIVINEIDNLNTFLFRVLKFYQDLNSQINNWKFKSFFVERYIIIFKNCLGKKKISFNFYFNFYSEFKFRIILSSFINLTIKKIKVELKKVWNVR